MIYCSTIFFYFPHKYLNGNEFKSNNIFPYTHIKAPSMPVEQQGRVTSLVH